MHAFLAKFGALAMTPFLFFGGHAATVHPTHAQQPWQAHATTPPRAAVKITNIDGPETLAIGTSGSWTVNVNTSATSTLHYSATWGDEGSTTAMRSLASRIDTSATLTHTYASAGTYHPTFTVSDDNGHTATKSATVTVGTVAALHLDSVAPVSGAVGTMITVTGTGFADGDTATIGGVQASSTTYNDDGTLTFAVPQIAAGTYNVRIHNGDMKSNAVSFTVTAATPTLSVNGVDAPVRLSVGADGTWTVHAATTGDSLKYSVTWGDEGAMPLRMMAASTVQTSSTFTHAYQSAGTYSPKFTVTDDSGHSESVSATVVVTK